MVDLVYRMAYLLVRVEFYPNQGESTPINKLKFADMRPSQPQAPPPFQDLLATVAQQRQSQSDRVARLDRWLLDMKGKREDEMETLSRAQKRVADLDGAIASLEGKHKVAKQLLDELDEQEDSLADKVLPVTHSSVWREAAAQATRPSSREFLSLMAMLKEGDEFANISKSPVAPGLSQDPKGSASRSSRPASPLPQGRATSTSRSSRDPA